MESFNRPSFLRQKAPGSKLLTKIYVVQQSIIFFPYCVRYALCADDNHVFSLSCGKKKFCYSLCCWEALNALKFKSQALNIISLMSYTTASALWVSWSFQENWLRSWAEEIIRILINEFRLWFWLAGFCEVFRGKLRWKKQETWGKILFVVFSFSFGAGNKILWTKALLHS